MTYQHSRPVAAAPVPSRRQKIAIRAVCNWCKFDWRAMVSPDQIDENDRLKTDLGCPLCHSGRAGEFTYV